jgi:hypothetical protein
MTENLKKTHSNFDRYYMVHFVTGALSSQHFQKL